MKVSSLSDSDVIVQKLPCDRGIHRIDRKCTLKAPGKVLDGVEFEEKVVVDEVFPDEFDLEETHSRVFENTVDLLEYGKPVLSIGGDHSVSHPVLEAVMENFDGVEVVWLDAHLDMKEDVEGKITHDVVVRKLVEEGLEEENVWSVGFTRVDEDEEDFLEGRDFNCFTASEVSEFCEVFEPGSVTYLSIDIDVLETVEGTGYPDGELSMEEVVEVVEAVEPDFCDIVEVAPPLDQSGETVERARELVRRVLEAM